MAGAKRGQVPSHRLGSANPPPSLSPAPVVIATAPSSSAVGDPRSEELPPPAVLVSPVAASSCPGLPSASLADASSSAAQHPGHGLPGPAGVVTVPGPPVGVGAAFTSSPPGISSIPSSSVAGRGPATPPCHLGESPSPADLPLPPAACALGMPPLSTSASTLPPCLLAELPMSTKALS